MFRSHRRQARRGGDRVAATTSARGSLRWTWDAGSAAARFASGPRVGEQFETRMRRGGLGGRSGGEGSRCLRPARGLRRSAHGGRRPGRGCSRCHPAEAAPPAVDGLRDVGRPPGARPQEAACRGGGAFANREELRNPRRPRGVGIGGSRRPPRNPMPKADGRGRLDSAAPPR